jgi:proteic killer suppression protein
MKVPNLDRETEKIFGRQLSGKLHQNIQRVARKKLVILDAAPELNDLRISPGNRLEALKGDPKGQHSIRINEIVHGRKAITADTALRLG